ncbi:hypothetical protein AB0K87_15895, partial [Streptomyces sp. NPDC053705]
IDSMGIFYNKKMFADAGVEPPAKIADLKTVARAAAGAWAVRVHAVRPTADAVRVARAVEGAA